MSNIFEEELQKMKGILCTMDEQLEQLEKSRFIMEKILKSKFLKV